MPNSKTPRQSALEDGCELASSSRVTRACASHIFPGNEVAVTMGYGVDDEQAQGCDAEGPAHRGMIAKENMDLERASRVDWLVSLRRFEIV